MSKYFPEKHGKGKEEKALDAIGKLVPPSREKILRMYGLTDETLKPILNKSSAEEVTDEEIQKLHLFMRVYAEGHNCFGPGEKDITPLMAFSVMQDFASLADFLEKFRLYTYKNEIFELVGKIIQGIKQGGWFIDKADLSERANALKRIAETAQLLNAISNPQPSIDGGGDNIFYNFGTVNNQKNDMGAVERELKEYYTNTVNLAKRMERVKAKPAPKKITKKSDTA